MAKQLKLRRGTTAQHSIFTGASGEITVDTDKKTVVVHDGTTVGGTPLLQASAGAVGTNNLADNAVTTAKIAPGAVATVDIADAAVTGAKLENSGVTAGTYGSASAIPVLAVDAKGRVTSASTSAVAGGQYFGSAATKAIAYNSNTISENITITSGNNGLSAGPITISNTFTVTVADNANWVIV